MQYICYQLLTELGQFCKAYMKKNTPLPGALKKAFLDFMMI